MYKTISGFCEGVILRNQRFKVSNSKQYHLKKKKKKSEIAGFFLKNVWKSVKIYLEMIEDILKYVKTRKSENSQMVIFTSMPTVIAWILK